MRDIFFIYNEDFLIVDDNYNSIDKERMVELLEDNWFMDYALLNENKKDYLTILNRFSFDKVMQHRLAVAYEFKKLLPQMNVYFYNEENYYDIDVNEEGFSLIENGFDISKHILNEDKYLRIMFDWESTGVWNDGACIPLEWVPVSESTKNLVKEFQNGLNKQRIIMDEDDVLTDDEEKEIDYYSQLGLDAAIAIKKELPDWKIEIYNDGQYDLPFDMWGNSEIK